MDVTRDGPLGVPASHLSDADLLRELASLHRTRHDALRHAPGSALAHHDRRRQELEAEYLRRFPGREVWPRAQVRQARAGGLGG